MVCHVDVQSFEGDDIIEIDNKHTNFSKDLIKRLLWLSFRKKKNQKRSHAKSTKVPGCCLSTSSSHSINEHQGIPRSYFLSQNYVILASQGVVAHQKNPQPYPLDVTDILQDRRSGRLLQNCYQVRLRL